MNSGLLAAKLAKTAKTAKRTSTPLGLETPFGCLPMRIVGHLRSGVCAVCPSVTCLDLGLSAVRISKDFNLATAKVAAALVQPSRSSKPSAETPSRQQSAAPLVAGRLAPPLPARWYRQHLPFSSDHMCSVKKRLTLEMHLAQSTIPVAQLMPSSC